MSRWERQRTILGETRWPHLQAFVAEHLTEVLAGPTDGLPTLVRDLTRDMPALDRAAIASECWDLMAYFKDRYDDGAFLRDSFGVRGVPKMDDRGRGHSGLRRIKLIYDVLAQSVRADIPGWKPKL